MTSWPASENAWVSWDHHEGKDLRDNLEKPLGLSEIMHKAFKAGWEDAGGDQRLEAVDLVSGEISACPCHDPGDENDEDKLCFQCMFLTKVLRALIGGDE